MRLLAALLLIPLVALGQESEAAALIRKLRSEDLAEREKGLEGLKRLGDAALAELERHAGDADPDVAAHVGRLLAAVKIRRTLTPRLLAARPGIEHRLASDSGAWVTEYTGAYEVGPRDLHPDLFLPEDTEGLAVEAFKSVRDPQRRLAVLQRAAHWGHAGVLHQAARLRDLTNVEAQVVVQAIRAPEGIPALLALANHPGVRGILGNCLQKFRASEVGPGLAASFPERGSRHDVQTWLGVAQRVPSRFLAPRLREVIADPSGADRLQALHLLKIAAPDLAVSMAKELLADPDPAIRAEAVHLLPHVAGTEGGQKLADDPAPEVRHAIIAARLALEPARREEILNAALADRDPELVQAVLARLSFQSGSSDLDHARTALGHSSALVRLQALQALVEVEHEAAGPAAIALLGDPDEDTRAAALEALITLRWRPAAEALAGRMAEFKKPDERQGLLAYFGRTRADKVPEEIIDLIVATDEGVSDEAISWLERLRPRQAIPALLRRLDSAESRGAAARVLAAIPEPAAVEALRRFAGDESTIVRRAVATALRRWGGAGDLDTLRKLWKDDDLETRYEALRGITRLDPRPSETLAAGLADAEPVRTLAIREALTQGNRELAIEAIRAFDMNNVDQGPLKEFVLDRGPEEAARIFEAAWEGSEVATRWTILQAICLMRVPVTGRLLDKGEASGEAILVDMAKAARAAIDPESGVPGLAAGMLGGPRGPRSQAALKAIRSLHAIPALEKLLDSPDPAVCLAAIEALAGMGRKTGAARIRPFLKSPYAALRQRAIEWAAAVGDQEAAPHLSTLLADPCGEVVRTAAQAAGRLKAAGVVTDLVRLRDHPRLDVAMAALRAWAQLAPVTDIAAYFRGEGRSDPLVGWLGEVAPGAEIDAALRDGRSHSPEFGRKCEELLAARGGAEAAGIIAGWMVDADPWRRRLAVDRAATHGGAQLKSALRSRMKDPAREVREAAIETVAMSEGPACWEALVPLMVDPHLNVRRAAVRAIARLHVPESGKVLAARLEDPWNDVRSEAAVGLVQLGRRDVARLALDRPGLPTAELGFSSQFTERQLDEPALPDALNALRDPEAYRKLSAWRSPLGASSRTQLERMSQAIGRPVDRPASIDPDDLDEPVAAAGSGTLFDWLQATVWDDSLRLDRDRARFTTIEAAVDFWHRWLMGTEK